MKAFRVIHFLFGVVVIALVWMFGWDYYKSVKCQQEASRVMAAETMLVGKLEDYQKASGHYPDSTEVLSFTNSPEEIQMLPDVQRIQYRRTESGYALRYDGIYGYHSSEVSNSR
jgi:hypothetical protein